MVRLAITTQQLETLFKNTLNLADTLITNASATEEDVELFYREYYALTHELGLLKFKKIKFVSFLAIKAELATVDLSAECKNIQDYCTQVLARVNILLPEEYPFLLSLLS